MTGPTTRSTGDLVLEGLLRSAPLSVFGYDAHGVCFFSEGAALHDMGLQPGELVGKNLWELYADATHVGLDGVAGSLEFDITSTFASTPTSSWPM